MCQAGGLQKPVSEKTFMFSCCMTAMTSGKVSFWLGDDCAFSKCFMIAFSYLSGIVDCDEQKKIN